MSRIIRITPTVTMGTQTRKKTYTLKIPFPSLIYIYIHLFGIQMLLLDVTRMLFRFILTGGSFSGTCTSLCKRNGETGQWKRSGIGAETRRVVLVDFLSLQAAGLGWSIQFFVDLAILSPAISNQAVHCLPFKSSSAQSEMMFFHFETKMVCVSLFYDEPHLDLYEGLFSSNELRSCLHIFKTSFCCKHSCNK